jgi:hypothetical protein
MCYREERIINFLFLHFTAKYTWRKNPWDVTDGITTQLIFIVYTFLFFLMKTVDSECFTVCPVRVISSGGE